VLTPSPKISKTADSCIIVHSNGRLIIIFLPFILAPATTYLQGPHAGATGKSQRRSRQGQGRSPWRGLVLCSAASSLSSNFSPPSFCLSSAFGRSGGGGGTRRHQRARHGRKQLRLRPRPQPPSQDHQGHRKGGLLPEDSALSAELYTAPRVALLPAGRFVVL
jgi:hypothetical protein